MTAALVLDLPARFESLARLQPLRSLHFLYIVMFVVMGGFLAEYVLKDRVWRWLLLLIPLSLGMFMGQRALFPASAHVEWPGRAPKNPWAQAFVWIRQDTPVNAMFALDPENFAAGRKKGHAWAQAQKYLGQLRHRVDEVFAVIEHQ